MNKETCNKSLWFAGQLIVTHSLQVADKLRKNMTRLEPGFSTTGRRKTSKEYNGVGPWNFPLQVADKIKKNMIEFVHGFFFHDQLSYTSNRYGR
jgi:hypothetical protein